jgi:tRNA U55 pseudouridine synthase TruB
MKKIVKEQSEIIKKNEFVLLTNIESQNCKQLDAIIDIKYELNNIKSTVSNKSYSSALKFDSNSAKFTSIVENQSENVVIIRPKKRQHKALRE